MLKMQMQCKPVDVEVRIIIKKMVYNSQHDGELATSLRTDHLVYFIRNSRECCKIILPQFNFSKILTAWLLYRRKNKRETVV